eukprot:gene16610-18296_t
MLSEVTWENEMGDMNVDESWSFFRDKVITAIKDYIPLSVPKKPNAKPPYWNKSLTRHVRKKYNLFKRWERTGRESHYKEYAKQRNMTSKSVFVEENTSKLPDFDIRTDNIIEDIEFTVEDVKKKLDQLKEDKAAGPD